MKDFFVVYEGGGLKLALRQIIFAFGIRRSQRSSLADTFPVPTADFKLATLSILPRRV